MRANRETVSLSFAILFSILIVAPSRAQSKAKTDDFPAVEITSSFAPPGESNVRSSFKLADGVALIGTEETGDVFKTTDFGKTWAKTVDGGDEWSIQDVRNSEPNPLERSHSPSSTRAKFSSASAAVKTTKSVSSAAMTTSRHSIRLYWTTNCLGRTQPV